MSLGRRKLENWITGYMEVTRNFESPTHFHLWTAVFTIAGALGRKLWIEDGFLRYFPNFYIVFVGPPGVARKSTSINSGELLLREVPLTSFGPNSTSWQALLGRLSESTMSIPIGHGCIADTAEGSVFMGETIVMSCINVIAKELGPFLSLKNTEMIDVMTDLWDGTSPVWERKTIMHGDQSIVNPWINLIAATTPGWLRENTTETTITSGFASRCIFIYGDKKRHRAAYQGRMDTAGLDRLREDLVHDLKQIGRMLGSVKLSDEAYEWGTAWYEHNDQHPPAELYGAKFEGVVARRQTMLHKLALVLCAARGNELIITADILKQAEQLLRAAEANLPTIFDKIGMTHQARVVNDITAIVLARKRVAKYELVRELTQSRSPKEILDAINEALQAGLIREHSDSTTVWLIAGGL